ncbi:MAG: beta-galactosidase [Lentisphaeria bacterium]|nr:beta-galactosidase [Lentisphaeria bacterium]
MKKFPPLFKGFPQFAHGGDYNPDQWWHDTPDIVDQDMAFARAAKCNTFSVGIFSWGEWEPEEGKFDFSRLDALMDRMAAEGNHVLLATPSAAFPNWMVNKYPQIAKMTSNGVRTPLAGRHCHCWRSPIYREKVTIINTKLAQRYGRHPALAGWHISNEYNTACYCPLCTEAFRNWLKSRYGTLEELNRAWWMRFWSHTYTRWEQVQPGLNCSDGLALDWFRFTTEQICDFMRHEIVPLKQYSDRPVTTNMMGYYPGVDYWRIAEVCDFIADDRYPGWTDLKDFPGTAARAAFCHDMHRAMKKRPWLLMESTPSNLNWQPYYRLKRPGLHRAEELLAVAHGADGVMYFQFRKGRGGSEKMHGAVVDHARSTGTRVFRDVAEVGETLEKIRPVLGTSTVPEVAVVFDWDAMTALNVSGGPSQSRKLVMETILAHYRALWELNIPADVIESRSDFSGYKLVIAPMLYALHPGVAGRIREFVENGGVWVSTYLTAYVNETNLCFLDGFPGGGLREVFGLWNEELDGLTPEDRQFITPAEDNMLGWTGRGEVADFAERIHPEGAEVLGVYGSDFYAGEPALTVNAFGRGFAYYQAARCDGKFLHDFYERLAAKHGVKTLLKTPPGIHVMLREGDGEKYLFFFNFQPKVQSFPLDGITGTEMVTGERVEKAMTLPAFGSAVVRLD